MRATKILSLFAIALLVHLPVLRAAEPAEEPANSETNQPVAKVAVADTNQPVVKVLAPYVPPVLKIETRHEGGPGLMPADRVYVTCGSNHFALLLPAGFRVQSSGARSLTLLSDDSSCIFTFRPGQQLEPSELSLERCRKALLSEHPTARITQEFALWADSRSGPAFDAAWTAAGALARLARVVFIPSTDGVLEFSMVCDPDKIEVGRRALHTILLTFRASDPNGKLQVAPLSNQT